VTLTLRCGMTTQLLHGDRASLDIRKIGDHCLGLVALAVSPDTHADQAI
jgi:hypothetical protein